MTGMLGLMALLVIPACGRTSQAPMTVVGDSLSVGLANALQEMRPDMPLLSLGVVSSGLSNPRFVDWQAKIREVAAARPSLVLVMLGMNDSGTAPPPSYPSALTAFLSPLADASIPFVVISVPQTDDPARNHNIDDLNTIYEMTTRRLGGRFLKLPPFDRTERSRDGIHFTKTGYHDLATTVLAVLRT